MKIHKISISSLIFLLLLIAILHMQPLAAEESPNILITSVGQSPDARMINVLATRLEIETVYEQIAEPETIEDYKIVIAVVGGSSKGLGAAGIDKDDEIARTRTLIQEIKEKEVNLLVMHIGGDARRGALSDAFLDEVVPYADHLIIVESGNSDNYFTRISEEKNIPMESVEKIVDTGELVKSYIEARLSQ